MDFSGLYDIRDMKEEDKNFIRASFLKGLYYGDSWFSMIPKDEFMKNYKSVIEHFLHDPTAIVKVACLSDDPDTIIGYSILSADYVTVHWVYVKSKWRLHGIAKRLVPEHPTAVSHLTELGKTLLPKLNNAIFNPFKL